MGMTLTAKSKVVKDFLSKFEYRYDVDFRVLSRDPLFEALKTCHRLDLSDLHLQDNFTIAFIMRIAVLSDSIKELSLNFSNLGPRKLVITKQVASMPNLKVLEGVVIHEKNSHFDGEILAELFKSESIIRIIPNIMHNRLSDDSDLSPIYQGLISKNTYSLAQKISSSVEKEGCLSSDIIYEIRNSVMEVLEESFEQIGGMGTELAHFLHFIFFGNICDFTEIDEPIMESKKMSLAKVKGEFTQMPVITEVLEESDDELDASEAHSAGIAEKQKFKGVFGMVAYLFKNCFPCKEYNPEKDAHHEVKATGEQNDQLPDMLFETLV